MCILCTKKYSMDIEIINCNSCKKIKYLPSNLYNLKSLNIENTNIKTLSPYYINLLNLNIKNTKINKLYNYPYLKKIICSYSKITKIPDTLVKLQYLDCSNTIIRYLSYKFKNLRYLKCKKTLIKGLPSTYNKLLLLNCSKSFINYISSKYLNLKYLDCSFTKIRYIPAKLNNILHLDISYTLITKLYLTKLIYLNISNTKIKTLNNKFTKLKTLICYNTNISNIPLELYNLKDIFPSNLNKLNMNNYINYLDIDKIKPYLYKIDNHCSICLETLTNNKYKNIIYIKSCKHIFHRTCLFEWYKYNISCPYCRNNILK